MHPTEGLWREFDVQSSASVILKIRMFSAPQPSAGDAHVSEWQQKSVH